MLYRLLLRRVLQTCCKSQENAVARRRFDGNGCTDVACIDFYMERFQHKARNKSLLWAEFQLINTRALLLVVIYIVQDRAHMQILTRRHLSQNVSHAPTRSTFCKHVVDKLKVSSIFICCCYPRKNQFSSHSNYMYIKHQCSDNFCVCCFYFYF